MNRMPTVAFAANYINHHQIPFCEAMVRRLGGGFVFVQMEEMEKERLDMGWKDVSEELDWVLKWSTDQKEAQRELLACDLLIVGWVPQLRPLIAKRLRLQRPVFQISERIYKDGQWKFLSPRGLADKYQSFTRYRRSAYFLLCAGAYVGSDFGLIGAFPEKKYRWGYFPPLRQYEGGRPPIRHRGARDVTELIWAGRFVGFKHVERVLSLADRLQKDGKRFLLHIVGDAGTGNEKVSEDVHRYAGQHGLEESVIFHGFCSPEIVRDLMEHSDIFILTSDHGEGWGAVLNEAMNSGCAPIAGAQAGAVPYLIQNGVNGYVYADGDEDDLVRKTERLMEDTELCERFAALSFRKIQTIWNADTAAERFLDFGERVLPLCEAAKSRTQKKRRIRKLVRRLNRELPAEGPMSQDPSLRPFLKAARLSGAPAEVLEEEQ